MKGELGDGLIQPFASLTYLIIWKKRNVPSSEILTFLLLFKAHQCPFEKLSKFLFVIEGLQGQIRFQIK